MFRPVAILHATALGNAGPLAQLYAGRLQVAVENRLGEVEARL